MAGYSKKANSKKNLAYIDKMIKLLNYRTSKLVTSSNEFHQVLIPNQAVTIDLIESTPIYVKISTHGKIPPLKLSIEHLEATAY